MLAIHVDDGLLVGKNKKEMEEFIQVLQAHLDIVVEDNPKSFLEIGIENVKLGFKLK